MSVLLETRGLTVEFGGLFALKSVDLQVADGAIHGLIGPNGAGKSTMVNALTGLVPTSAGRIELAGRPLHGRPTWEIAGAGIARTFQNIRHFAGMTVLENTLVGAHRHFRASFAALLRRSRAARAEEERQRATALETLAFVGLRGREEQMATGLSYGHQRRLEIARALMLQPRLLLLDEPLAGMNAAEKDELADIIRAIRDRGVTVLIIEHDMQIMRVLCDRLSVLHHGALLADGTPKEVFGNPLVQSAYLGQAA